MTGAENAVRGTPPDPDITPLIASADDLVFPPQRHLRALKDEFAAMGKEVTYTEVITTDLGHLDGIAYIAKAGDDIAWFLAQSDRAKPPGSRT